MTIINDMEKPDLEIVKKTLDLLLESVETFEQLGSIKFAIDDYLEEGYEIKEYISKYNDKVGKFYSKRN